MDYQRTVEAQLQSYPSSVTSTPAVAVSVVAEFKSSLDDVYPAGDDPACHLCFQWVVFLVSQSPKPLSVAVVSTTPVSSSRGLHECTGRASFYDLCVGSSRGLHGSSGVTGFPNPYVSNSSCLYGVFNG